MYIFPILQTKFMNRDLCVTEERNLIKTRGLKTDGKQRSKIALGTRLYNIHRKPKPKFSQILFNRTRDRKKQNVGFVEGMEEGADTMDRISELPEHIIHHILSVLRCPKDVTRTSVLSKRWRSLWVSFFSFNFDQRSFHTKEREQINAFKKFVDYALATRLKPMLSIQKFRLHLTSFNFKLAPDMNHWISAATDRNVKDLEIHLEVKRNKRYILPQAVFTSKTITSLKLHGCKNFYKSLINYMVLNWPSAPTRLAIYEELKGINLASINDFKLEITKSSANLKDFVDSFLRASQPKSLSIVSSPSSKFLKEGEKDQTNGKKRMALVGPWGGTGGISWDDGSYNGVREIRLVYDWCIDSIHVLYDKKGKPVSVEKHGGSGGNKTAEIKLQFPDEFLVGASGHYCPVIHGGSSVIRSLTFKSNRRTFGPYGVEVGTPFSSSAEGGGRIVGFKGRSGWYIDEIGFYLSRAQKSSGLYYRVQQKLKRLATTSTAPLASKK